MKQIVLPDDQRWIVNEKISGEHAVDKEGNHWSYCKDVNAPYRCKVQHRGIHPYITIFDGCDSVYLKLSDVMATSWLGCDNYIFADGDPSNTKLSNIIPLWGNPPEEKECWIAGYEGTYSILDDVVFSFKDHIRKPVRATQGKVSLYSRDGRKILSVSTLKKNTVSRQASNSNN